MLKNAGNGAGPQGNEAAAQENANTNTSSSSKASKTGGRAGHAATREVSEREFNEIHNMGAKMNTAASAIIALRNIENENAKSQSSNSDKSLKKSPNMPDRRAGDHNGADGQGPDPESDIQESPTMNDRGGLKTSKSTNGKSGANLPRPNGGKNSSGTASGSATPIGGSPSRKTGGSVESRTKRLSGAHTHGKGDDSSAAASATASASAAAAKQPTNIAVRALNQPSASGFASAAHNRTGAGAGTGSVTAQELAQHSRESDCWIAINGEVYDVTSFLTSHPGGMSILTGVAGRDASKEFKSSHPDLPRAERLLQSSSLIKRRGVLTK